MALLQINDLHKTFGGIKALDGVDFHIDEGEIVSVIGPNGAGKTSFFNVISGMYAPDGGEIIFDGVNISGWESHDITRGGIARTFQNVRLFPNMTVLENIMVAQHCRTHQGMMSAIFRTKAFKQEEGEITARAKDILGFFGSRLVGYRFDQGFTVVVIEQDMKVVLDVSDRAVVLDHGVKIAEVAYEEVSSNEDVIEAYLGRPAENKT
jgi:branched-chain amino acid transport system ATP-binding protein